MGYVRADLDGGRWGALTEGLRWYGDGYEDWQESVECFAVLRKGWV